MERVGVRACPGLDPGVKISNTYPSQQGEGEGEMFTC